MSSPPDPQKHTEDQLAGIACIDCRVSGVPLFGAGTLQLGGGGEPVRILPVMKCWGCMPDRQMIVIASSAEASR